MPNNLKTILLIAIGVVALGTILLLSEPSASQPSPAANTNKTISSSKIIAEERTYDFGTISMKNGNVTKAFKIKNTAEGNLSIKKLYTSCMCTNAVLKIGQDSFGPFGMLGHGVVPEVNQVLGPNQEADIEVTFDPNAHGPAGVGIIERVVSVEDAEGGKLTINIKANVTP